MLDSFQMIKFLSADGWTSYWILVRVWRVWEATGASYRDEFTNSVWNYGEKAAGQDQ